MLEFTTYLKSKSLRNSIILFGILMLTFISNDFKGAISSKAIIFVGMLIWFCLYYSINHNVKLLKSGSKDSDLQSEKNIKILKQVEGILTVFLIFCVFANLRGWLKNNVFIILPITIYLLWYIYAYRLVYTFLKQNSIGSE